MKTAMQELIEYVESNEIVYNKDLILKLKELLEKEKEQICNSYYKDLYYDLEGNKKFINAEDYYNQTYNQNK